jgi:diguanylate cyclase (GGDEF)-like protein
MKETDPGWKDKASPHLSGEKLLQRDQIAMIEDALASVGDYGEVRLVVEKGRLRFLVLQKSVDVLKEPNSKRFVILLNIPKTLGYISGQKLLSNDKVWYRMERMMIHTQVISKENVYPWQEVENSDTYEDHAKQTVLIIEDDHATVEVIKSALGHDQELLFATQGKQALAIARNQLPDLILLDSYPSDMTGFEICSRLKINPSTCNIPVILIGSQQEEIEARATYVGAFDYITKPIQPATVRLRVRNYLELKRCRDMLENLPTVDPLTGLPNQRQLEELIEREWRRAIRHQTPQSLLITDIDFFNTYNDINGRQAGDDCLRQIASVLVRNVKREPDLVARYGGDEFACLLPETDACGAIKVANSIQEAMEELNIPFDHSQYVDHVTLSFGVATMRPDLRQQSNLLIDQAELLRRKAQNAGHNQIRCQQDY